MYVINGVLFEKNNLQFMINRRILLSNKNIFRQCFVIHCRKVYFDYSGKATMASASTNAPLGKDATPTAARAG